MNVHEIYVRDRSTTCQNNNLDKNIFLYVRSTTYKKKIEIVISKLLWHVQYISKYKNDDN